MDSQRTKQSLGELNFHLFDRPVHPELFNIYESLHFFQGDYEVIIWNTGGSHVISVFVGPYSITELVCPPEQLLPKNGLIETFGFRGSRKFRHRWPQGLNYHFNADMESMSPNLYKHTYKEFKKMGRKRGLLVEFPQAAIDGFIPFSYLDFEARCNELHLYTYHALAESQTVLKTQSLFDFRRKQ
jgi:hypothetical protein